MQENELGGPMPELGTVDRVDMRLIWPKEAHNFTPWLASHLDLLGDPLGMELELVQREANIGGFFVDILARKPATGELVVIENQLDGSNHSHLGKLLTYSAAQDARAVIWVAASFRGEHRATIDWLNDWTPEEIAFYGVEVSAIKIGESLPAPVFHPVAFPNAWSKQKVVSADSRYNESRIRFYQPLVDALIKQGFQMRREAHPWFNKVRTEFNGLYYYPYIPKSPRQIGSEWLWETSLKFAIDTPNRERNVRIFNALKQEEDRIWAECKGFGNVKWDEGKRGECTVATGEVYHSVDDIMRRRMSIDETLENSPGIRKYMLTYLPKFIAILNPRLERIMGELQDEEAEPDAVPTTAAAAARNRQASAAEGDPISLSAYCVKCREKRDMTNARDETTKNGKPIIKGACAICGTGINIIGKTMANMKENHE